ncbi:MAG: DNA repair protein RecO [Bacteroidales bacterium]|nr:DNA repair protein RecO [Bacteroidales bacterium]
MLQNTRGIVLHHIRYSETSLIVKIYTEAFGLQAYLVKGARSKRSKLPGSMFRPMTLLDMIVYHRPARDLQHIREASIAEPFHSIASDIRKSTVAIFLSEILLKTIKEHESNSELFDFMASSLHFFDLQKQGIESFHLYLLVMLSHFLGLYPQGEISSDDSYFDLREGKFSPFHPAHADYLEGDACKGLYILTQTSANALHNLKINRKTRDELLNMLVLYYQIHLSGMGTIRSLEVLREVFR